ncbi:MAG: DUF5103 domain-containing protein [Bacteroidota bacterium]|nr:DUF5103 domain-containing protein [Bacteroidota bacterium]
MSFFIRFFIIFYLSFYHLYAVDKTFRAEDWTYESTIKTVILYEQTGAADQLVNPPVISLDQPNPLILEFDELKTQNSLFYFKIIPCDMNWVPNTNLLDSEYLKDFINDYLITTYQLSFNTRTKYVHYKIAMPRVKISGNFVVAVFRNDNQDDLILTKRFMIFDSKVSITPNIRVSMGVEERFTHQQVDFTINYANYPYIYNPMQEVKVVVRQNYRWDNALTELKPLYVRENERMLDYNYFNLENNFLGGKEFRFFDTRKTRSNSMNVDHVEFTPAAINVYIMQEKSRADLAYGFTFDVNGRYIPANNEVGGNMGDPDYTNVIFDLKLKQMPFGSVYVIGGFNDYKINESSKLNYDATSESYKCTWLLKQGYYNYVYAVKSTKDKNPDFMALEGSSVQTENMYEIIVYHRPIGSRNDVIIGYYSKSYNGGNTGGY